MQLESMTKKQLINKLEELQIKCAEQEKLENTFKRTEQALRKNEEMLRGFIDSAMEAFILFDNKFNVLDVNDAALCMMYLKDRKEIVGENFKEVFPYFEKTERFKAYNKVMKTGKPFFSEDVTPHPDYPDQNKYFSVKAFKVGNGLGIITSDITERKHAEEALRESEEKHRSLFETMTQGVVYQDDKGNITSANPVAEQILGLTLDQMMGRTSIDPRWKAIQEDGSDYPGSTHPSMVALGTGEEVLNAIMGIYHPEKQEYVWININAVPNFKPGEDKPYQVYTTFENITERKYTKELLQLSEARLRRFYDSDLAGFARTRVSDGKLLDINNYMIKLLGYKDKKMCIKEYIGTEHWKDPKGRQKMIKELKKTGYARNLELPITRRDGNEIWVQYSAVLYLEDDYIEFVIMDITEHKQAEEKTSFLSSITEQTTDGIIVTDKDYKIAYVNKATEELFGYSLKEIQGKTPDFMNIDPRANEIQEEIYKTVSKGKTWIGTILNQRKDKSTFINEVKICPIYDSKGKIDSFMAGIRDVTDRITAEEALKESEEKYRKLYESSRDGIATANMKGGIIDCNEAYANMLGYSKEELKKIKYQDITPSKWHSVNEKMFKKVIENGYSDVFEKEYIRKDGTVLPVALNAWSINDEDGNPIGVGSIVRDITERKHAEEAVLESEEKLTTILHKSPIPTAVGGSDGSILSFNEALEKLIGYKRSEIKNTNDWSKKLYPDKKYREFVEKNVMQALKGEEQECTEFTITCKDGTTKVVDFHTSFFQDGLVIQMIDISEQKHATESLKESVKFSRNLINSMKDGFSVLDKKGVHIDVNPAFCEMTGFKKQELIDKGPPHPYWPEEEYENIQNAFKKTVSGKFDDFELVFKRKNGERFPVIVSPSQIKDANGKIISNFATIKDITEPKKADEALQESEEKYRRLVNNLSDVIMETDTDGNIIYVSPSITEVFGYSSEDVIGDNAFEYIHPHDLELMMDKLAPIFQSGETAKMEYRIKHKNGHYVPVIGTGRMIEDGGNKKLMAVIKDITEIKKAHEEMEKLAKFPQQNPNPVLRIAKNGVVLSSNSASKQLLKFWKYKAGKKLNKDQIKLVKTALNSDQPQATEVEYGGKFISLIFAPIVNEGFVNVYGLDITERKIAEKQLKFLSEITQQATTSVITTDKDFNINWVNDAFTRLYGYEQKEVIGQKPDFLNVEPTSEDIQNEIYRVISNGYNWKGEALNEKKDGSTFLCELDIFPMFDNHGNIFAYTGHQRDITERKKGEEALRKSKEKYSSLIKNIPDVTWTTDSNGKTVFISSNIVKTYGYSQEEIYTKGEKLWFGRIHSDDLDSVMEEYEKLFHKGTQLDVQYRIKRKDGKWIWLHDRSMGTYEKDGILYADGVFSDITERKHIEEERAREKTLVETVHAMVDSVLIFDTDGVCVYANPQYKDLFATTNEEFIGKSIMDLPGMEKQKPEEIEKFIPLFEEALAKGKAGPVDLNLVKINGLELPVSIAGGTIKDSDGKPTHLIAVVRDITERKQLEEELKNHRDNLEDLVKDRTLELKKLNKKLNRELNERKIAEEEIIKLSKFPQQDPNPVLRIAKNGQILYHNSPSKGLLKFWDYKPDKKLDKKWFKIVKDSLKENQPKSTEVEYGSKTISLIFAPIVDEGFVNVYGLDITDRKDAEKAMRDERDKAQTYLDIAGVMFVAIDVKGKVTLINKKGCEILGYQEKEIVGKNWFDNFVPKKIKKIIKPVSNLLLSGKLEPAKYFENSILTKKGEKRLIAWHNTILRDKSGKILGHLSSGEDITDKKQAEIDLLESEQKFRTIFEGAMDGILAADIETSNFVFANPRICEITGYSEKELIKMGLLNLHPNEAISFVKDQFDKQVKGEISLAKDIPVLKKNGELIFCDVNARLLNIGGKDYLIGFFRDMTEQKQKEQELIRLSTAVKTTPDAVIISNLEGEIIDVNQAAIKMLGVNKKEVMVGKSVFTMVVPEDQERALIDAEKLFEVGYLKTQEYNVYDYNKNIMPVEMSTSLLKDPKGETLGFVAIIRDINERKESEKELKKYKDELEELVEKRTISLYETNIQLQQEIKERKNIEQALVESREILKRAQEIAQLGSWEWDVQSKKMKWSDEMYDIYGVDQNKFGKNIKFDELSKIIHPDDLSILKDSRKNIYDGKNPKPSEIRIIHPDGAEKVVFSDSEIEFDEKGVPIKIIGTVQDITDRKQKEELIKSALEEKELLLNEIHHRVKNNLQIISSLLNIQSSYLKDNQLINILNESKDRIRTMALVHEALYQSSDFTKIDFQLYVQKLVNYMYNSYGIDSDKIKLNIEIENIHLPAKLAIPCGLIINELASNSLKYAFPGNLIGEIYINLRKDEEDQYSLIISDNGTGIPKEVNYKKTNTLGLHLVNLLVEKQLGGSIKHFKSKGAKFNIRFGGD